MASDAVTQRPTSQIWHHQENVIIDHSKIDDLADVRVHQLRRGLCFPLEALAHLVLARQVRMKNLYDDWGVEDDVKRVIHARHAALTDAVHDGVSPACHLAQRRYRRVRWRLSPVRAVGHDDPAAYAARRFSPVPAPAVGAEHRQAPNCMRTKSYGGHGPVTWKSRVG